MGRNVRCELISADVIHGFYVPAFRIQEDAVPGIKTFVWFNSSNLGSSYILCSQYCGRQHSTMIAKVIVVLPDQYDAWMAGKKVVFTGASYQNMPAGQRLLFERGCISCHSLEGNKMMGPTFKGLYGSTVSVVTSGAQRTITADSAYINNSIVTPGADVVAGYPNTMPPSKDIVSASEISEIITYLKGLK
jgi:cytochrome c oxidase subunit II